MQKCIQHTLGVQIGGNNAAAVVYIKMKKKKTILCILEVVRRNDSENCEE